MNTDIFETEYFLSGLCGRGVQLNRSRERSQINTVSVSGFTGFVWTEGPFT